MRERERERERERHECKRANIKCEEGECYAGLRNF